MYYSVNRSAWPVTRNWEYPITDVNRVIARRQTVRYNVAMVSIRKEDILKAALDLPASERAKLATKLISSLDDEEEEENLVEDEEAASPEVEAAWAAELERRADEALAPGFVGEDWETVRKRTESMLRRK